MKFSSSLLSTVLLVATTLAAPSPALQRRLDRRAATNGRRLGNSLNIVDDSKASTIKIDDVSGNQTVVKYSHNWGGAAITSAPTGQAFNQVAGTVTVTKPTIPQGVAAPYGTYAAAVWVGIDGWTSDQAILQTGIDMVVDTTGAATYNAWYEWFPDIMYDFDLVISAGDVCFVFLSIPFHLANH